MISRHLRVEKKTLKDIELSTGEMRLCKNELQYERWTEGM